MKGHSTGNPDREGEDWGPPRVKLEKRGRPQARRRTRTSAKFSVLKRLHLLRRYPRCGGGSAMLPTTPQPQRAIGLAAQRRHFGALRRSLRQKALRSWQHCRPTTGKVGQTGKPDLREQPPSSERETGSTHESQPENLLDVHAAAP